MNSIPNYDLWAPSKINLNELNDRSVSSYPLASPLTSVKSSPSPPINFASPKFDRVFDSPAPSLLSPFQESPELKYLDHSKQSEKAFLYEHLFCIQDENIHQTEDRVPNCENEMSQIDGDENFGIDIEFQHILLPVVKMANSTVCRYWLTHKCTRGDKCQYSHDIIPGIAPFPIEQVIKKQNREKQRRLSTCSSRNQYHHG